MMAETVRLRLTCVHPPPKEYEDHLTKFGLQDKDREVHPGTEQPDGSRTYEVELPVTRDPHTGKPRFGGSFVHGTPAERFLYLTLQREDEGNWAIVRRLKIHLRSIEWEQIEAARARPGTVLEAAVDGRGAASVPLLGDGWTVRSQP